MIDMIPGWGYLFLAYIAGSVATFITGTLAGLMISSRSGKQHDDGDADD